MVAAVHRLKQIRGQRTARKPAVRIQPVAELTVSDFKLPTDLLRQLDNWERLNVDPDEVKLADDIRYSIEGKMTGWLYLRPTDLNLVGCSRITTVYLLRS